MGAGWCDYDNDGSLDIFTARNNYFGGNNCLYHNNGNSNKFINIKCAGMVSNKCGIGAKVYVKATIGSGSMTQMREISSQTGGAISGENCLNAVFGLGNTGIIDSLIIKWPSGIVDKYAQVQPNNFVTVVEGQIITTINQNNINIPEKFSLFQNYPNPFNKTTTIKFHITTSKIVKLSIFDLRGCEVATLMNEQLKPGMYEVEWDGTGYPSGTYYYKLFAGDYVETKKMILMK
jgi:hypothetical protein